eukprot:365981-Chlamydomonas_euryale.AAC.12
MVSASMKGIAEDEGDGIRPAMLSAAGLSLCLLPRPTHTHTHPQPQWELKRTKCEARCSNNWCRMRRTNPCPRRCTTAAPPAHARAGSGLKRSARELTASLACGCLQVAWARHARGRCRVKWGATGSAPPR